VHRFDLIFFRHSLLVCSFFFSYCLNRTPKDQRSITGVSGAETPIEPMEALLETSKPTGADQPRLTKMLEDVHLVPRP
jgi:hypothetical protein